MVCNFFSYIRMARFLLIDIFTIFYFFNFSSQVYHIFADSEVPTEDVDEKVLTRQSNPSQPVSRVSGRRLTVKHITALTIKRFHHSKRNKKGLVCEVGLGAGRLDMLINAA